MPDERIFPGDRLRSRQVREAIRSLRPDLGISVLFHHILQPDFLAIFPRGVVNLHPAFLPYNRGPYPNVWPLVEGTPAGTTLHYVDSGIDTGDIIARREVAVEPVDTGETLYRKLERASLSLFQETWPRLKAGETVRIPQDPAGGTSQRARDTEKIDPIDPERAYRAKDLINLLRARTFPPYRGAYFVADGRRVYLRLQMEYGEEEAGRVGDRPAGPAAGTSPLPDAGPGGPARGMKQGGIFLRDLRPEDKELIRGWRNSPEVAPYMYRDHYIFPAEHERWMKETVADPTRRYWIIRRGDEDLGLVNLYRISLADRRCHWAFYVAHPGARGRGVGTCIEYLILKKVFEEMGFHRLCCEVLASNRSVIAMHEKFGFIREGYFRQHVMKGGRPVDVVSLAMTGEDWERKKPEVLSRLEEKGLLVPERGAA